MRTFKHFPESKKCPICNKSKDGECILIPIDGTTDGNNCEAIPVHVECMLDGFRYNREHSIFYILTR